ncbi:uncharacterized protein LOC114915486 [Cajanus cajan]|uniref:uncharacterized protein LOC114915486 n=1 Tax=Cajanus cajan TaxID=3821 RepID=UPI0010FB25F3|nr:uncharacterized protein LOC114915486 [Cajanus cajan]
MSPFSIAKGVESLTNRLSALSLINEDKIRGMAREIKLQGKKINSLEEAVKKGKADLQWVNFERDKLLEGRHAFDNERKTWASERSNFEKELEEIKLARDKSVDAAQVFEGELTLVKAEVERLQADLHAVKMDALKKFMQGFDAAKSQVNLLHADIDLEGIGYFKEIVDGELVDPPEDD